MESQYQYVLTELRKLRFSEWQALAVPAGVPWQTVEKIARGKTRFPRVDTVEKLARYFSTRENPV